MMKESEINTPVLSGSSTEGPTHQLTVNVNSDGSVVGGVRVSWQDKKTESGIEITGGSTTVSRFGTIASAILLPVPSKPGSMSLCALIAGDDKLFYTIPLDFLKIL